MIAFGSLSCQGQREMDAMESEQVSPIMTIDETVAYLNLHSLTVRHLAREGEILAAKIGRQ